MSEESKRVLELDEKATPGEWTWINADSSINRAGRLFGNGQLIIDAEPGIFYDNIKDITLIAEYRALAPQLARQVDALERALLDAHNRLCSPDNCVLDGVNCTGGTK